MVFSRLLMRALPYWLTALAFLLLFSSCNQSNRVNTPKPDATFPVSTFPANAPGVRHFADTWDAIHSFLSFGYNVSDPTAAAKRYDFVWGAQLDHVAALRAGNPNIFLSYYIPFHRAIGSFAHSNVFHDLAYWKAFHSDWILYKCDRTTPAYEYGDPGMPLDFENPAVLSWQIQTYAQPASESGYDAIAADNVDLQNLFGACGVYVNGRWVQRYSGQPDDPQWRQDILAWLSKMQAALHQLHHPLALIPNLALGDMPPTDPLALQIVSHSDGILDEGGFTNYGMGYPGASAWLQTVRFMEYVQSQGKPYYLVNQFPSVGQAEIQWALASYLMGKDHLAEIFISPIQGYGVERLYPEYNAPLGSPLGSMSQTQDVYIRPYSHGVSLVNPGDTTRSAFTLQGGPYYDLTGAPVPQPITLAPHSGLVLLTTP